MPYLIMNWDKYQGWKSEQKKRPDGAAPYPWLKLYRKTLDSMDFFAVPEPIRWQWFALLCLSDDNGVISETDERIAWRLRVKVFDPKPFISNLLEPISDGVPMNLRCTSDESPTRGEERRGEDITHMPEQTPVQASVGSEVIPKKSRKRRSIAYTPEFEAFWRAYPRGEDKILAFDVWERMAPDAELQKRIIEGVEVHKRTDDWIRGIGIPYAVRFLSRRKWESVPGIQKLTKLSPNGNGNGHPARLDVCPKCTDAGAYRGTDSLRLWILCSCGRATQADVDAANGVTP